MDLTIRRRDLSTLSLSKKEEDGGGGNSATAVMGPLINPEARHNFEEKVREAVAKGVNIIMGGNAIPNLGPTLFQPTVMENIDVNLRLQKEEIFGPMVAMHYFEEEEEAIQRAKDYINGITSYFYTRDLAKAFWNAVRYVHTYIHLEGSKYE